ncbi:hypothetical protein A2973_00190 [Candidatus Gottesmanbacteria bacterium RIFCSPLOWO2_01_FULL_49_10]|uniref:Uncharacterized protein n=1 Tax=Candidatus Gottesmanbacteria bacterium RIFCSPLOWO2_01_FULL_49_10 TaxID=1798396 RepID=A0A1F6AYZ6_9BACT|nr:MAG: hypothetical protein A2973_00190 [Candidatus Gottesmanbacteria bacterium RIFCSPLOWO2_01_FULL_49_10]
MAELVFAQDGHSWNNAIAHAAYGDNIGRFGEETARQLLREDIRSWIRERRGEGSQWSLFVREGEMVTEAGVSLQEMTNNITSGPHSNLVPETIKATVDLEAATLEEATRLAAAGADRIVLPEQHLDDRGNVVSRYLSVWKKNASDPSRYDGTRIDLGKNVRIEDVRTGTSFTAFEQHESVSFYQHRGQKHAFVLAFRNNAAVPFESVKDAIVTKVHRSHQETYSDRVHPEASPKDERNQPVRSEGQQTQGEARDPRKTLSASNIQRDHHIDALTDVPRIVVRDTAETVRGIAVFLRDKHKQKESDTERRVHKDYLHVRLREKKTERLTLEKIREKPVRMVEVIGKRHSEVKKEAMALGVIAETGVAVHAAPVILARLAEKLPTPIMAIKKSIERHTRDELKRKKKELRKTRGEAQKDSEKVYILKPKRVEPLRKGKERKKSEKRAKGFREMTAGGRRHTVAERGGGKDRRRWRRRSENGFKKNVVAELLKPSVLEKREKGRVWRLPRVARKAETALEGKHLSKREKKLWVKLAVVAEKFRKLASQGLPRKLSLYGALQSRERQRRKGVARVTREGLSSRSLKVKKERIAAAGMQFAWMAWVILGGGRQVGEHGANSFPIRSTLAKLVSERRSVKLIHPEGAEHEGSPWVILSIIWYLALLREGAFARSTVQHQKSQPKAPRWLPQQAVIYAFAAGMT